MISIDLINRSGIWPHLANAIVGEICLKEVGKSKGNLRCVPMLEEDGENFFPLQVIRDTHSSHKTTFVNKRLIKHPMNYSESEGGTWFRRALKKLRGAAHTSPNSSEFVLEESSHGAEFHPYVSIGQSIVHSTDHPATSDRGIVKEVCIDVRDVHVRRVDPRLLLGCTLHVLDNKRACRLRVVYETHIASQLKMKIHISSILHDGRQIENVDDDECAKLVARNCPLAYRFIDVELSKVGLVTEIHFRPLTPKGSGYGTYRKGERDPGGSRARNTATAATLATDSELLHRITVLLPTVISQNKLLMAHLNGCQKQKPIFM